MRVTPRPATALLVLALLVLGAAPLLMVLVTLLTASDETWGLVWSTRVGALTARTALLGLSTSLAAAAVGVPVALGIARRRGFVPALMATLLPLPLILPPWMTGLAWSGSLRLAGFWGATLLLASALWPLVALFALRGLRDAGLAGDAATLARGRWQALRAVELPIAMPSILTGMLLVFVLSVTDFGVVDFLSFNVPEPFTVLTSEIWQKWQRLGNGAEAAAVSLPGLGLGLAALWIVLAVEQRYAGRHRGAPPRAPAERAGSPLGTLGLVVLLALMVTPVLILTAWASRHPDPLTTLLSTREEVWRSVTTSAGAGLIVALLGVAVARALLSVGPRTGALLLGLALLPLAVPGVLFAVGVLRVWHHPANPLGEALYRSPLLLVLAMAGRFLPLGVLAARALLLRQDPAPAQAARLMVPGLVRRWLGVDLALLAPATGMACTLGYVLSLRELDVVSLVPAGNGTLLHQLYSMVHIQSDDTTALLCLTLFALVLGPAGAARRLGVPGAGRASRS
jgi:iron(III) transport system permease protein